MRSVGWRFFFSLIVVGSLCPYGSLWWCGIQHSSRCQIYHARSATIHAMKRAKSQKSPRCWFLAKYVYWWADLNKCIEHEQRARAHTFSVFLFFLIYRWKCVLLKMVLKVLTTNAIHWIACDACKPGKHITINANKSLCANRETQFIRK